MLTNKCVRRVIYCKGRYSTNLTAPTAVDDDNEVFLVGRGAFVPKGGLSRIMPGSVVEPCYRTGPICRSNEVNINHMYPLLRTHGVHVPDACCVGQDVGSYLSHEGTWDRGVPNFGPPGDGFKRFVFPDGKGVYEGNWRGSKRHGQGSFTFANGDVYDGENSYDVAHMSGGTHRQSVEKN